MIEANFNFDGDQKIGDSIIVVMKAKTFDLELNDLWPDSGKSYPREGIVCGKCGEPVVISNGVMKQNPRADKIRCLECAIDMTNLIKNALN